MAKFKAGDKIRYNGWLPLEYFAIQEAAEGKYYGYYYSELMSYPYSYNISDIDRSSYYDYAIPQESKIECDCGATSVVKENQDNPDFHYHWCKIHTKSEKDKEIKYAPI